MSWRIVVIAGIAKLDYQLGALVIRKETVTKIHISEISVLVIESTAVSMTAALLCELVKQKIKVIFCDEKRNPLSELIPYYGCHDSSRKLRRQLRWETSAKEAVWTAIVKEKIGAQANLLQSIGKQDAALLLREYITQLKLGDATNREGHAAKVYFNALFGKDFTRESYCTTNAALNYGYSILLSAFNREIAACGYLTQLGIFHDNIFNHFNLASDLMEPFRPLVDAKVYHADWTIFAKEEKMELVALLNTEVIIGNRKEFLNNAIGIYCRSVFDALEEKDPSILICYRNEL